MPRPAPIPLKGTFDSRTGIYNFDGHSYKARWYANALQQSIDDCKLIVEAGHREDMSGYPQAVLVVSRTKWEQIKKSYATWIGLTMFHYYDPDVNPGELPAWLSDIKAHNTKLIHEKSPGVCYLLTYPEPNYIYRFFVDSAPAPTYPPAPAPPQPQPPQPGEIPAPALNFSELPITGKEGAKDIDLLLKFK